MFVYVYFDHGNIHGAYGTICGETFEDLGAFASAVASVRASGVARGS